jgi:hypothetical protein
MLALALFGGALLGVLPREPGISWQSHLGGAIAGAFGAWWLRAADPLPPRVRYSWEDELDDEAAPLPGEPVRIDAVRISPRRGDWG